MMTKYTGNMARIVQLKNADIALAFLFTLVSLVISKEDSVLNECERGVKRHHPSQANLFQIFTRKDYRKQWLDYPCPEFMIFDPRSCECAESNRPETLKPVQHRSLPKGQSVRQRQTRTEQTKDLQSNDNTQDGGKGGSGWTKETDDSAGQASEWSKESLQQSSWGNERENTRDGKLETQDGDWTDEDVANKGQRPWTKVFNEDADNKEDADSLGKQDDKQNGGWGKQDNGRGKQDNGRGKQAGAWGKQESGKQGGEWGKDVQEQKGKEVGWEKEDQDNSAGPDDESEPQGQRKTKQPPGASDKTGYGKKQDETQNKPNAWDDRGTVPIQSGGSPSKGGDCHLHRPSGDKSHFERWSDGKWVQEDCNWPFYTGLVWNQASCRCEWGPNRTHATPMIGDSVPASCLMMLKMSFDGGNIVDEGRHIWLNIKDKENAAVESDPTAAGGKCGSFRGSAIAIPYFKSNLLGSVFHIGFSFKLCPGDPDTDIPLIHNDCIESQEAPGIVIVYQAWKKRIVISMRTMNSEELHSEFCNVGNAQGQWTKVDIRYGENFLEVTTNKEVCISSNKFMGPVATNNCPLTLLGEAFCGKLDEVIITRGCTDSHAIS
ncbi:unnamed protein product [Lymnaea stagnalis]|uniref:Uncharacterized protein n=1 Tax=Lymnaea stagnalis TaxID=6523 RepID=A0AAV2I7U5_LYMST